MEPTPSTTPESLKLKTLYFKSLSAKCSKHSLPFKGLQKETNTLMCSECLKELSQGEDSILPIFTAEDEESSDFTPHGQTESQEIKDNILKKKQEAEENLTGLFKSIHDLLYDIEGRKLEEVDQKIRDAFGRNLNFDALQRTSKVLREKAEKVKKRVDKDEFQKIVSK